MQRKTCCGGIDEGNEHNEEFLRRAQVVRSKLFKITGDCFHNQELFSESIFMFNSEEIFTIREAEPHYTRSSRHYITSTAPPSIVRPLVSHVLLLLLHPFPDFTQSDLAPHMSVKERSKFVAWKIK